MLRPVRIAVQGVAILAVGTGSALAAHGGVETIADAADTTIEIATNHSQNSSELIAGGIGAGIMLLVLNAGTLRDAQLLGPEQTPRSSPTAITRRTGEQHEK